MDIEIVEVRIPKAINSVEFNQGTKGDRGVSITDFTLDDDGNAVTTFDNGETKTSKLTSIASASASAKKAATSEANAKDSADKALTSETNAKTSETNAVTYEDNAKKSEIAAKTSETNAAASASTATAQASNAGKSATAAKTSETNAKSSETASATSAANAKASASNAAISASNSASSASASEVSSQYSKKWAESTESPDGSADTDSTTGKTQSSRSWALYSKAKAQESASSATSASDSASAAASSAASSSDSKDKASEYKTSASGSATAAASSASSASTSAKNAKAAMNTANTAASSASTSAINASTSASNSSKSEVAAKSAQAEAERARDEANSALAKISGALKYMGQVDNYNDLPSTGNSKGDTWNVVNADPSHHIKAGDNVAWNGTEWDDLSGVVDLSAYAEKADYQKAITSATANGATITFNHKDGTTSTATVNNVASSTSATNDAKGQKIDTTYEKISDASNVHTSLQNSINTKLDKTGGTATGAIVAPSFQTGNDDNNYFQCRKFRGEGNANTYYHAIDFGYSGHGQVDFYEYGGTWNFWHNRQSAKGGTLVGSIKQSGWNGNVVGNVTGNSTTATKLQTARTISLTGNVSGSATFDGSTNINISTTVNESKHAAAANNVVGMYLGSSGDGGKRGPDFFGKKRAGCLMSNQPVNGHGEFKNWLYMDNYDGTDVGGATAIGVSRSETRAYIMSSNADRKQWDRTAELLSSANYNEYAPTKTGGGASGTWGINISGNAATSTKATQDASGNVITDTYATISALSSYQTKITFDSTPTANSSNPVTSAGIKAAIDAKTVDLSNYYTKTQVDSAISTAISAIVDGDSKSY